MSAAWEAVTSVGDLTYWWGWERKLCWWVGLDDVTWCLQVKYWELKWKTIHMWHSHQRHQFNVLRQPAHLPVHTLEYVSHVKFLNGLVFLNRVQTDFQFFTHPYFTVDIELRVMYITRTIPLALSAVLHYTTPFTSHNDSTVSHEPLFTCKCLRFHWVSSCCVC